MSTVQRGELLAALENVRGAVPSKPFMPILEHVLVSGQSVIAFDNEVAIKSLLATDTGLNFNVPHDKFYNLVRNLEGTELDITVDGKKVLITAGKHKSTMLQIVEDEFPKPIVEIEGEWSVVPAGFKEGLERALTCASTEEANRIISAILVKRATHTGDEKAAGVYGVDGKRCCRCTIKGLDIPTPMLLSRKAVEEIIRLGNPSRLVVAGPWAVFDYTNLTFLARLREGAAEFPPVDKLFEKLGDIEIHQVPERLNGMLARLRLFGGFKPVVVLNPTPLMVEFTAHDEKGVATEYLDPIEGLTKKAFPADQMLDALGFAESINWGNGPHDPIYLKGEASGFEFLLMPVSL